MSFARAMVAIFAICLGGALFAPAAGAADSTTWMCKPGQADNPCAGPLAGTVLQSPGTANEPFAPQAAADPPVDCFYLYPTQSSQAGPNANLDKDPPLRRVAVQQARQFSQVCDVYAPMYNQYTLNQLGNISDQDRDIAYNSVVAAWKDYLNNYNDGRGVILVGHSQGSSHLGRLIREQIDPDASLRNRLVSAIIPGANIFVPKGRLVGGQVQNIPACSATGQFNCVIAYSMYDAQPPEGSQFARTTSGYWAIPGGAPDPELFEVMCVNPATLDGGDGRLDTLINSEYIGGVPASESTAPWWSIPDFYRADCMNSGGASWLNITRLNHPGDTRLDLASVTAIAGHNLHTVDINLAEGNLVKVAGRQSDAYVAARKLAVEIRTARARLENHRRKLHAQIDRLKASKKKCSKARNARGAKKRPKLVRRRCVPEKKLGRKVDSLRAQVKRDRKAIDALV